MKTTIKILSFAYVIFTVFSCATITSSRTYNAFFYTEIPNISLRINDSENQPIPSDIELTRSSRDLQVQVLRNDSVVNESTIYSRLRIGTPIIGNLFSFNLPGLIIDIATERGFSYGEFFVVDSSGEITRVRQPTENMRKVIPSNRLVQHRQGNFNILYALPYINFFHLHPQNETARDLWGFIGFGLGVEYFYRNNRSLQLRGDGIMTFEFPFPVSFHPEGHREIASSLNINLTDNFTSTAFV